MFNIYYILTYPFMLLELLLIKLYKLFLSPIFGKNCNALPTCSSYGYEAIKNYGAVWGLGLTFKRLMRCHKIKGEVDLLPPNLLGNYKWKC